MSLARFAQGAKIAEEASRLARVILSDQRKRRRVNCLNPRHHSWRATNTRKEGVTTILTPNPEDLEQSLAPVWMHRSSEMPRSHS